jgi:hypothetical protein
VVEVPNGEAHEAGVFYCAVDSFGVDGTAVMTTQAGDVMSAFLKECRWKLEIHAQVPRM